MPGKGEGKRADGRATKERAPSGRRRRVRLLWLAAMVAAVVYFYYKPIASYQEARHALADRRAEVQSLRRTREELRLRLADSTSAAAVEREARRLGYVKPGEQLFVVKGIPEWRKQHAARQSGPP